MFKKSANLNDLDNWSIQAGLTQLVTSETRQRLVQTSSGPRVESSAIDHVYTNVKIWNLNIEPSVSDHHIIELSRPSPISKPKREKILVRDWRNYKVDSVNAILNTKMHQMSTDFLNLEKVQELYSKTLDEIAPIRVIRIKEGQIISMKVESLKKCRETQKD